MTSVGAAAASARVEELLRARPRPTRPSSLDLTEDSGIITAVTNDIGTEAVFSRHVVIAPFGRIPHIQEAQAGVHHVLHEAAELSVP